MSFYQSNLKLKIYRAAALQRNNILFAAEKQTNRKDYYFSVTAFFGIREYRCELCNSVYSSLADTIIPRWQLFFLFSRYEILLLSILQKTKRRHKRGQVFSPKRHNLVAGAGVMQIYWPEWGLPEWEWMGRVSLGFLWKEESHTLLGVVFCHCIHETLPLTILQIGAGRCRWR